MYKINNNPFKMSRQMNNNRTTKTNETRVPKCLTCEKAGLTGKALEHYTRKTPDPNSEIVCPTILSFKCGYCGQAGHSKGFCQALKTDQARLERDQTRQAREEERRRNDRRAEEERQRQETTRRLKSNIFTGFNDDDEEENEREEALRAEVEALKAQLAEQARIQAQEVAFPSLCKMPSNKQQATTINFVMVAKNAADLPIPKAKPKFKAMVEEEPEPEPIIYEDDEDSIYEDEDDYTEYVPDTSFGAFVDAYETPGYMRKYCADENQGNMLLAQARSSYTDNDW